MYCTLNGAPVLAWKISMPLVGIWVADLTVQSQAAVAGPVALELPGLALRGTAFRGGVTGETALLRVVGGAGRFGREVTPKFYRNVPARLPVADLLTEVGEVLAANADAQILGTFFGAWARQRGRASEALRAIAAEVGASWRVLPEGTVWIGVELWPISDVEHVVESEEPEAGRVTIATDDHRLRPGVTFLGRRVARVEIVGNADRVRTHVGFESEAGTGDGDRMRAAIAAMVRQETAGIDYLASYAAKVVAQNGDGTLEIQPDDERLPGMSQVPIRYGVPGVEAKVAPGSRVLVAFEAGNPARPIATVWESATVLELVVSSSAKVQVNAPAVDIGSTASIVKLAGGTLPVARISDAVTGTAGPFPLAGVVSSGNPKVLG